MHLTFRALRRFFKACLNVQQFQRFFLPLPVKQLKIAPLAVHDNFFFFLDNIRLPKHNFMVTENVELDK